ncbi:polysaccharide pyruvyl transferase family protein [Mycolicibacterium mucogenicum]|nr:polysaccharide pyruvyl transferase family protein [Mycolicibacterium mucogenicum]QPG69702.1 polysaccharide pyruvyl transferase family protein [Mycolicibacterium mucogenicum DSM 44124]
MAAGGEILTQYRGSRSIAQRVSEKWAFLLDSAFSSEAFLVRSLLHDVTSAAQLVPSAPERLRRHLLIPTVGKGNIGDQAMLEAFLANTTWSVTVVVEHNDGHAVPVSAAERVRKVVMPELFTTRPWVRSRIRPRLASLIASHATLSVIGADVMDGGYGSVQSIIRFGMLCMGNEVGTPNRALGFSWNGAPPREVKRALGLSQPRSLLCLRDPHSLARIRMAGDYNVIPTADMVFTLNTMEPYDRIRSWRSAQGDRALVIINVSGILARNGVDSSEYVEVIRHLLRRGCSVVLLPHVIRAGDDDLTACGAVAAQLDASAHVHLVRDLLSPAQVAWLAAQATAILTGRMHLSILSLNHGVPSAVLSTQGKVSGLMELFDIPELTIEPQAGFAAQALSVLDRILDDPKIRLRVSSALPRVRELADKNFAGLEEC